jgi:hypothetical protein
MLASAADVAVMVFVFDEASTVRSPARPEPFDAVLIVKVFEVVRLGLGGDRDLERHPRWMRSPRPSAIPWS